MAETDAERHNKPEQFIQLPLLSTLRASLWTCNVNGEAPGALCLDSWLKNRRKSPEPQISSHCHSAGQWLAVLLESLFSKVFIGHFPYSCLESDYKITFVCNMGACARSGVLASSSLHGAWCDFNWERQLMRRSTAKVVSNLGFGVFHSNFETSVT